MSDANQEYLDTVLSKYSEMSGDEFDAIIDRIESYQSNDSVNGFKLFTDIDDWLEDREPGDEFTLVIESCEEFPYSDHYVDRTTYTKLENDLWRSITADDEIKSTVVDIITKMLGAILCDKNTFIEYRDTVITFHPEAKGLAEYCLWKGVWENHKDSIRRISCGDSYEIPAMIEEELRDIIGHGGMPCEGESSDQLAWGNEKK